ncbi:Glutaredoxin 3 (Grx2) [Caenispirillum salinarum AK4]|uniref:Glutaredoxin n=1 Tax=Caenispirillum salinarum AK4 TaxID=1238182 RepID=K9H752_9PROT|nr:glutaredoxin 3 [Caenispirillum salinarum]EKV32909.1 Glutaredoxin 3 (Grx2) [Caenispirillum salinarum AK4]
MAKVEVYSSAFCPFCVRAKKLLTSKGVDFEEIDVMQQPERRKEMERRAHGGRTVPQIFIDNEHVGGCDELMALERKGALDVMLGA